MAESDATPTTPADDGRARVNSKGGVDVSGGRRAFVWCQDEGTGHRFDLPARALPKKGVRVVEGYPLNFTRFARTAKARLEWETAGEDEIQPADLAGNSASGGVEQGAPVGDGGAGQAVPAPRKRGAQQ